MTDRQTLLAVRDHLLDIGFRRWRNEGWRVQADVKCNGNGHNPARETTLAWLDKDNHILHLAVHPEEKEQPVEKTLLHEVIHIATNTLVHRARDERNVDRLEELLWPYLTATQRRQLRELASPP